MKSGALSGLLTKMSEMSEGSNIAEIRDSLLSLQHKRLHSKHTQRRLRMKKTMGIIGIFVLFITNSVFASGIYTDEQIANAVSNYQVKMEYVRKEFNKRTNRNLLQDLNVAAADVTSALASMAAYLDAAKAFNALAAKEAGTQIELIHLTQDLLSGNPVQTEGLTYTIPSFALKKGEEFKTPGEAVKVAERASGRLSKLIKIIEKRKRSSQRGRGGVSSTSELTSVYNKYIRVLSDMRAIVDDLSSGLTERIRDLEANIATWTGHNARIVAAIKVCANYFSEMRQKLKQVEEILVNSLKPADSGLY